MFPRSMVRTLLVACFAFAAPAAAFADDASNDHKGEHRGEREGKNAKAFPMDGAKFKAHIETRITKMRQRIVARLEKKQVPAEKQKQVLSTYDAGAAQVRTLAETVAKDGTVTKEEAKQVRSLAKSLREKAREGRQANRGKGKGKGKDKTADA